jgi:hypothetical protein
VCNRVAESTSKDVIIDTTLLFIKYMLLSFHVVVGKSVQQ